MIYDDKIKEKAVNLYRGGMNPNKVAEIKRRINEINNQIIMLQQKKKVL